MNTHEIISIKRLNEFGTIKRKTITLACIFKELYALTETN